MTVQPRNGAVRAFSITITDADMYYDTGPMTYGSIVLDLGRDTFAEAPPSEDEALNIGPRWASFVRCYSYGGVAGNRFYYLAFNGRGIGIFYNPGSSRGTGIYASCGLDGTPPDSAKITANTLTVVSPEGTRTTCGHARSTDRTTISYGYRAKLGSLFAVAAVVRDGGDVRADLTLSITRCGTGAPSTLPGHTRQHRPGFPAWLRRNHIRLAASPAHPPTVARPRNSRPRK